MHDSIIHSLADTPPPTPVGSAGSVLIMDDDAHAADTLRALLAHEPYEVTYFSDPHEALKALPEIKPDVILSDAMMPTMTGMEFCRLIRQSERWRHVPVIMITGLASKQELAECLSAGADDFLSKPVSGVELRARVRSMMRIKKQYDSLEEALRLRQDLAHMLVHDIKNPLTSILVNSEFLVSSTSDRMLQDCAKEISTASRRINAMVNDLLTLAKMEAGRLIINRQPLDIGDLLRKSITTFKSSAHLKEIKVHLEMSESKKIIGDASLIQRVFDNLLSNALKFSPQGSNVYLRVRSFDPDISKFPEVQIEIADEGMGIPEEHRARIFEKFEIGEAKQNVAQIGLGLAFCKLAIEAHGGQISLRSNDPAGSIFTVEL